MKYFILLILLGLSSQAQDTKLNYQGSLIGPPEGKPTDGYGRVIDDEAIVFVEEMKPFYHGVASGDPTSSSVIIWTRITPDVDGPITVNWKLATDVNMNNVIKNGSFETNQNRDYTVKEDVTGLEAGTTYYYQFDDGTDFSIIGRTRTTPAPGSNEHLRFAVVSCVNYQWGYFNALERISERADLDAVIHMGDYIYEYGPEDYAHPDIVEFHGHTPEKEIISLADYRLRYAQYRLDPHMIKMHQQHPMIAVWDDHESTNDSYRDGAENHQEGEGDWADRVDIASQVYQEWMPIRMPSSNNREIYRKVSYGDALDLFMLELRLSGKDKPMGSKAAGLPASELTPEELVEFASTERKMIDDKQFNWLVGGLATSEATWKLMGSSVMMVPFPAFFNPDAWDGFYYQRELLFGAILQNGIQNVGAISGDFHMAFGTNLLTSSYTDPANAITVGFEFTTPSVNSANINEQVALPVTDPMTGETVIINPLEMRLPERSLIAQGLEADVVNSLPWFHYANSDQHGYMVLDVKDERIQCDWFFVGSVLDFKNDEESSPASGIVTKGNPLMTISNNGPADGKANAPELAPNTYALSINEDAVLPMGVYPNPVESATMINFALNKSQNVKITLIDLNGKEIMQIANTKFNKGVHGVPVNLSSLINGTYFVKIDTDYDSETMKLIK